MNRYLVEQRFVLKTNLPQKQTQFVLKTNRSGPGKLLFRLIFAGVLRAPLEELYRQGG